MKLLSALAAILLALTFAGSTRAQSFPPTFSASLGHEGNNPFENPQSWSFERSTSIATDPSGTYSGLYMAYGSTISNDYLYVGKSTDGVNWTGVAFTTLNTATSPSLAFFDGYLWIAWISNGGGGLTSGALYLDYTDDPSSGFSASPIEIHDASGDPFYPASSPTLAVYQSGSTSELWIAAVDDYDTIDTASISGVGDSVVFGVSACTGENDPDGYVPQESAQVGMIEFNSSMYYAYQTSGHYVRVCSTTGASASYSAEGGYTTGGGVSATVYDGYLALTFKDDTSGNQIIIEGTSNGTSWTGEDYSFSINGNNEITPSAAVFNGYYYTIFTGNTSAHKMWTAVGD